MSVWIELWVRLKVVDLVAQTAWLTLTDKLDFAGRIHGLLRYSYWGFTADGSGGAEILDELDRVVRMDSAFINQNKHLYRLMIVKDIAERGVPFGDGAAHAPSVMTDTLAAPAEIRGDLPLERDYALRQERAAAVPGDRYVLDCLIRERNGEREAGFTDRLMGRLREVRVSGLKAGELWRIILSAAGGDEALETAERIAVTRSRREGLLLNPHYQVLEIVSYGPLPVETARERGE